MKTLTLILELLKRLLDFIKNKKVQEEAEHAKENPADWFNEHFGEGRSVSDSDSDGRVLPDTKPSSNKASDNSNAGGE